MSAAIGSDRTGVESPALWQAVRVLRERWWIILLTTVLCVGIALANAMTSDEEYQASSQLLIRSSQLTGLVDATAANATDPERELSTNLLLVRSTTVAERVRERLGLRESPEDLVERID